MSNPATGSDALSTAVCALALAIASCSSAAPEASAPDQPAMTPASGDLAPSAPEAEIDDPVTHARGKGYHRMDGALMGGRCELNFSVIDTDRNGSLTRQEFAAWPQMRIDTEALFTGRDRDGSGALTRIEFCEPQTVAPEP